MKTTIEVDLKWYTMRQNNSGGYFIRNNEVRDTVIVQASSPEDAESRAESIICGNDYYCECCGERWHTWFSEGDGEEVPSLYGKPIDELDRESFRYDAVLYYFDGTKRFYKFGVGFVPYEQLEDDE